MDFKAGEVLDADRLNGLVSAVMPSETEILGTDIDCLQGNSFFKHLTENTSFTISNMANGQQILLALTGDSNITVSFPECKWLGGSPQGVSLIAGSTNLYSFVMTNGTVYGTVLEGLA